MESVSYKCAKCSKSYKKIASLKKHILVSHTVTTEPILEATISKPKKAKMGRPKINICMACDKTFSSKYTLERHIHSNSCKTNKPETGKDDMLQQLTTVLTKLIDDRHIQNSGTLLSGNNNTMMTDNHTENHITQNNNNNNALYIREIHINPMGKENLSHISDAAILDILKQGVNAVPALAKAIMEVPENCNIVESDKRNHKATVVNRNGDVEIMDLSKALTMSATDTVDRVDDYYEKFKDELPKQNKSIQKMARAHGLDSDVESEDEAEIPKDETFDAYFKKYMSKIKDTIDVNKKPIHDRLNKYKEHKYKEKTAINKQNMPALSM